MFCRETIVTRIQIVCVHSNVECISSDNSKLILEIASDETEIFQGMFDIIVNFFTQVSCI